MTLGVAVLAVALLAGIWWFTGSEAPESVAMGETMRPAPAIELARLGGGEVNLADYRGQVVLVNFWGTWCEPCRRELPALQSAYEQLEAQGFTIIGVNLTRDEGNYGNDEADIQAFLDAYGVTFPIALDYDGEVTNDYRVFPLPTSFFIDPDGNIRYVRVGEVTFEDVVSRFEQLRGASTAQQ
jgi:peroxiredoxin